MLIIGFGLYADTSSVFSNCYVNCAYNITGAGTWANTLVVVANAFGFADLNNYLNAYGCTFVGPGTVISGDAKSTRLERCLIYSTNSVGSVAGDTLHPGKTRLLECAYNVAPTNAINIGGTLYAGDPFRNRAGGDFRLTDALYGTLAATTNLPGLSATTYPRTIGAVPATASGGGAPMIGSRIGKAA